MKLLRYGPAGQEKPGVLDAQGLVRDLSGVVPDIAGAVLLPANLTRLRQLRLEDLPLVPGLPQQDLRLGACVGQVGKCICIGLNRAYPVVTQIKNDHLFSGGKWVQAIFQMPADGHGTGFTVNLAGKWGAPLDLGTNRISTV